MKRKIRANDAAIMCASVDDHHLPRACDVALLQLERVRLHHVAAADYHKVNLCTPRNVAEQTDHVVPCIPRVEQLEQRIQRPSAVVGCKIVSRHQHLSLRRIAPPQAGEMLENLKLMKNGGEVPCDH